MMRKKRIAGIKLGNMHTKYFIVIIVQFSYFHFYHTTYYKYTSMHMLYVCSMWCILLSIGVVLTIFFLRLNVYMAFLLIHFLYELQLLLLCTTITQWFYCMQVNACATIHELSLCQNHSHFVYIYSFKFREKKFVANWLILSRSTYIHF